MSDPGFQRCAEIINNFARAAGMGEIVTDAHLEKHKELAKELRDWRDMERIFLNSWPKQNGCIEWGGHVNDGGYGYVTFRGRVQLAHRAAYTVRHGDIPNGLVLDHLCRNRRCINPDHLEPVTHIENTARGDYGPGKMRVTACRNGHEYTPENTYWSKRKDRPGAQQRFCRHCTRMRYANRARKK